jgi:preprotein translocase subunit SecG
MSLRYAGGDNARSDRVTPPRIQTPQTADVAGSPAAFGLRRKAKMQTVIIVVHLMIVAVMIGMVLLQKSEGGGLGMGGGAGFMSSRGTANLLSRTTAILAAGFFITSLFLNWLASYNRPQTSIITPATQSQPAGGATPIAPPTSGGILDSLKQSDQRQGTPAPAAPSAPEAPKSQ